MTCEYCRGRMIFIRTDGDWEIYRCRDCGRERRYRVR